MAEACLGGGLGCGGFGYGCSPSIFGGGGAYLPYTGASYGGYGYGGQWSHKAFKFFIHCAFKFTQQRNKISSFSFTKN